MANDSSGARLKAVTAFQFAGIAAKTKSADGQKDSGKTGILKKVDLHLPPKSPLKSNVADCACIETSTDCDYPIPALIYTDFNVNAKHGGGTALLFATRVYNNTRVHSTELFLIRCGFDGNHFSSASLAQVGDHNYKNWNDLLTDSDGFLRPKLLYGRSTATLISNIAAYGHGGCGVLFEGPDAVTSTESNIKIRLPPALPQTENKDTEDGLPSEIKDGIPTKDQDGEEQNGLPTKDQDGEDQNGIPSADQNGISTENQDCLSRQDQDGSSNEKQDGQNGADQDGHSSAEETKCKSDDDDDDDDDDVDDDDDDDEFVYNDDDSYNSDVVEPKADRDAPCALVICSALPTDSGEVPSQTYFLHFDEEGGVKKIPLHSGSHDDWTFEVDDEVLDINGPIGSRYVMFHSKSSEFGAEHLDRPRGKVRHLQAVKGSDTTTLLPDVSGCVGRSMLLLCSHSFSNEDSTVSALYQVTILKGGVRSACLKGIASFGQSSDIWTFSLLNDKALVITGPNGPCRYAILTNIPEDVPEPNKRCLQNQSIATGSIDVIRGGLVVDDDKLTIWVERSAKVLVTLDGVTIHEVEDGHWLEQPDGRLAFQRKLTEKEKIPGMKIFRAFAIVKSISGEEVPIELEGSPKRVIKQPPGVAYALNCGGPAYQALNNAVFNDFQTVFVKDDNNKGIQCNRKFSYYTPADHNVHGQIGNTYDTFLFTSNFKTHQEFADEFTLDLPISSGEYTMRLYSLGEDMATGSVIDDDESFTHEEICKQVRAIPDSVDGLTAKTCEVPLKVKSDGTTLKFVSGDYEGDALISGILVYDKNFQEPKITPEEKQQELKDKQELADKLQSLNRTFVMKEMKIAGWSANLLENASGGAGDMSNWNFDGDFKIVDGGDGTEKTFVTSHMDCTKSQEIDLAQHFSEKYLDTAPEIQASESFHAGVNEGGYYTFTVTLSDADGNQIAQQSTGEKGSIPEPGWIRESFTFKDYGPGLRNINFESSGRDNKCWAGHFGTYISAGKLRVKSEVTAASDDKYADVTTVTVDERKHQVGAFLRELTAKYKTEMADMRAGVSAEDDDAAEAVKAEPTNQKERKRGKLGPGQVKPRKTKREVRIFVSSTFRDFSEEREMIIKKVFRELNRLCLDRGVFFTYVDLRWGITETQTKSGKTIEICLREVDKCRPYFICMMGDRYGWSQTERKKDHLLNESFTYASNSHQSLQWVDDYRFDTSVTKLEVLYAAIRPNEKINKDRMFFYLRQPRVSRDELPAPVESTDPKDQPRGETQWHFDHQQQLRQSILDLGFTSRSFEGATDGSAMIRDDLMKCIDEDFPPGTNLSHLEREREAHDAFAEVRRRVYIGGQQYFDYIDNYFEGSKEKPLTIIGESGSGKSALVANWCGKYEEKNPDTFLFVHFIGSSAESASYLNLLRRLYDEMKQFFELDMEVPSSDRNLVIDLPSWLKVVGKRSKVMIVLDALNQLDSGAGGSGDDKDLKWLPSELPENVHMLMSTLPGQTQDAVSEFGWPMYKVEPLQVNEKRNIISGYMGLYGKTLNQEQTDLIIKAKQSSNPLYLKALLDEVRVYGVFEQLTTAIKSYLTAESPGALFVKILERLEKDFEDGDFSRPGLVRDTTVAIWCSRRGMSENELMTLLKIPSIVWSPFYLSLEENLINKNGIVNFFHDHLRQAVEARYLPTDEDKRQGYLTLANFFNAQDIDDRYADEMPYLLAQAGEKTRLRATIVNVLVFQILMKTEDGRFQLIKAWRMLGGFEHVEQAYLDVLSRSENQGESGDKVELIKCMALFFTQLGLLSGARILNERLLKDMERMYISKHSTIVRHHLNQSYKHRCNHPTVIDVLIELGDVCQKQKDLTAAEFHLEDALTRLTKANNPGQKLQLVKALIGLGTVHRLRGQLDVCKKFLQRALEVSKEVVGQDHHYVAALVGQLGELCYDQSRLEEAMVFHVWDFTQTQKNSGLDHPHIAAILNNIGLVQDDMQDKSAKRTFKLALGILLEAYGKDHVDVATVRYNLGARFFGTNMYEKARYQFEEAHRVFNLFLEDHPSTRAARKAVQMVKDL